MVRATSYVAALAVWALSASGASCVSCKGEKAISAKCPSREAAHHRDFFYVGGRPVETAAGTITTDQLYVEKLTPAATPRGRHGEKKPIVFVHGGGGSGTSWLNTPDGRPGWASNFLRKGHTVYVVDYAAVGRSLANNLADYTIVSGMSVSAVEMGFTAVADYNTYPQSQLHTQWPGTGRAGDPVFDLFQKAFIPINTNWVNFELAMRASGCELLSLIGEPAYVVSHSIGARVPLVMSNDCPDLMAGNINVEGTTIPFWSYGWGLGGSRTNPWGLSLTPLDVSSSLFIA